MQFKIRLENSRWELIDPSTEKMVAHSATYEGLLKAQKEIQSPFDDPINKMREGLRTEHLGRVLAERYREIWGGQ